MESIFRTQKFDFAEILRQSIEVIRLGAARLLPIALLAAIPQAIVLYITQASMVGDSDTSLSPLCALCGLEVVLIAIVLLAYTAGVYTVEAIVQGRTDGISVALQFAASRLPQMLLVALVFGLAVMIGTALFIIPGIIVGIYLAFAMPAAALRNVSLQAFQYSRNLVKGQWWRVFGTLFGIGILNAVFNYVLNWMGGAIMPFIGIGVTLVYLIASVVSFLLTIPVMVFFLNEDYLAHPLISENPEV